VSPLPGRASASIWKLCEVGSTGTAMPTPQSTGQGTHEPAFLILGRIMRPHGVRGELRIQVVTKYPERIAQLNTVYIGPDPYDTRTATACKVQGVRRHREQLLIRVAGVTTRDDAEQFRGQLLMVALEDAIPLNEGEYYVYQVLNARVVTTEGEELGRVSEVLETGANDVFIVQGGARGEVLIPDVPHVVLSVDIENKVITVDPPPGLLPD